MSREGSAGDGMCESMDGVQDESVNVKMYVCEREGFDDEMKGSEVPICHKRSLRLYLHCRPESSGGGGENIDCNRGISEVLS